MALHSNCRTSSSSTTTRPQSKPTNIHGPATRLHCVAIRQKKVQITNREKRAVIGFGHWYISVKCFTASPIPGFPRRQRRGRAQRDGEHVIPWTEHLLSCQRYEGGDTVLNEVFKVTQPGAGGSSTWGEDMALLWWRWSLWIDLASEENRNDAPLQYEWNVYRNQYYTVWSKYQSS